MKCYTTFLKRWGPIILASAGITIFCAWAYLNGVADGSKTIQTQERIVYKCNCSCAPVCNCCGCADRKDVEYGEVEEFQVGDLIEVVWGPRLFVVSVYDEPDGEGGERRIASLSDLECKPLCGEGE